MSISQTTSAIEDAGPTWRQLGETDFGAIGFATGIDVAAALLLGHIMWKASWPPYAAVMPQIVVFSSLAAMLATIGVSIRYGMWREVSEELGCNTVTWFIWLGLGALFSSAFLRVVHYHDVLVRQSGIMWPVACQMFLLMLPCTVAPALLTSPDMAGGLDSASMECLGASLVPEYVGFTIMAILTVLTLVLTFRLRVAQVQAPHEFKTAVGTSITLALASISLPLLHFKTEPGQEGRREGMLVLTALTSSGVVAIPVLRYVKGYIVNQEELKDSGDFNFGKWRSREDAHYRLTLYRKFKEAASSPGGRNTQELPAMTEFFRVLMAREDIESYPLIQASTMRILDTYYRAGAPSAVAVSMSNACRSTTLTYKASSSYIFDTARREMLHKMGVVLEARESGPPLEVPKPILARIKRSNSPATSSISSETNDARKLNLSRQTSSNLSRRSTTTTANATTTAGVSSGRDDARLASPREEGALPTGSSERSSWRSFQRPVRLSPLCVRPSPSLPAPWPSVTSPLNHNYSRREAPVSADAHHESGTPLRPPLGYHGFNSKKEEKTTQQKKENAGTTSGSGDGGVVSTIVSLFSMFKSGGGGKGGEIGMEEGGGGAEGGGGGGGGGEGGRGGGGRQSCRQSLRIQDDHASSGSSPSVFRMVDDDDTDGGTKSSNSSSNSNSNSNSARPTSNQGKVGAVTTKKKNLGGKTGGLGGTGVLKLTGVQDLHAAFGLVKGNDDDDETSQYQGIGAFGGKRKNKKKGSPARSGISRISGYGNMNELDSPSSPADCTDLADAAYAIEHPLFGDTSRAVGRQNSRASANGAPGSSHSSTATTLYAPRPIYNNSSGVTDTTSSNATIIGGYSQELPDASGGGGSKVLAMVQRFEGEGRAEALGGAAVTLDGNDSIARPPRIGGSGSVESLGAHTIEGGEKHEDTTTDCV